MNYILYKKNRDIECMEIKNKSQFITGWFIIYNNVCLGSQAKVEFQAIQEVGIRKDN